MKHLSIVIPIYNEEAILEKEIAELVFKMGQLLPEVQYEILLVENGSFDRTKQIVEELVKRYPEIRGMYLPTAGYGLALKQGLLQSAGTYTVLFNIDLWDVHFVRKALELFKDQPVDMVVGSKTMPGAEDNRPWLRRLITRTFNKVLRGLFNFRGTDTHGMKVLMRERMLPVVAACRTEREIFDTEFVLRAQAMGLTSAEVPVVCVEKRKTTYHIAKRVPRTIKDLLTLFFTLPRQRRHWLWLGLIVFSIVFFCGAALWGFPDSPSPWFDEGINLGIAKTFAQDGIFSLRLSPGQYVEERGLMISTNYPVLLPISIVFYLFGVGLAQAKVVMLFFLIGFLLAGYRLVRRRSTPLVAALSVVLVVTFLPFYGNGLGGGLGEVPGLFYFLVALLLFEKEKTWQLFVAGIFFGLGATTKVFYLVTLGALAIGEIVAALQGRRFFWKRWLVLAGGMLLPLALWLRTLLPHGFTLPEVQRALVYYRNPYHIELHPLSNLLKFVTESTPLHFTLAAVLLLVALYRRVRMSQLHRVIIMVATFAFFNVLWFLRTPGWYRYLFPAQLLVLLFLPMSAFEAAVYLPVRWLRRYGAVLLISALLLVQAVYLVHERATRLYYNPEPRQFASRLEEKLGSASDIFIIDQPELWFLLHNNRARQYLQMNPYVAFGERIFDKQTELPHYLVVGNPEQNQYVSNNHAAFVQLYQLKERYGRYSLFEKK